MFIDCTRLIYWVNMVGPRDWGHSATICMKTILLQMCHCCVKSCKYITLALYQTLESLYMASNLDHSKCL